MDIFENKILLVSWDQPTGILITSFELSNHYKAYFDEIWDSLLPAQSNCIYIIIMKSLDIYFLKKNIFFQLF